MNNIRKNGFTLIEMIVATGILGVLMVGIVAILLNTFKAKTTVSLSNRVEANANYVVGEIRKNLIGADNRSVSCFGNQLTFNDLSGVGTTLSCVDSTALVVGYIASASATTTIHLSEDDPLLMISGCANFVSCEVSPVTGNVSKVNIGFTLSAGVLGTGSSEAFFQRPFSSSVTLRN